MTEAWKWIQDGKPEPEKEAECKSTQESRATSFMLTCASPNMPCGDYFPTESDVTLPLLSLLLLLALPCFSPPFIAKWINLLIPTGIQTLSTVVWQASPSKLQRFLIDDRALLHFITIATKWSPWYDYKIVQLFFFFFFNHCIWETPEVKLRWNSPNKLSALPNGGTSATALIDIIIPGKYNLY